MDSPARNPSPPPELREHAELLEAERIGNTAFSKHWLFTTLMKLIEEVDRENEEGMTDLMVDVDEELQNELCKLWDMSMNSEVSKFLEEFQAVDILTGIIDKSKAPRVTEICVGILANMACDQSVCKSMSEKQKLIEIVLLLLESRDPPTLVETTRLIYSSVSNTGTRGPWINAIRRSEEVLGHLLFIFQSSTNCDLLKNTAELVDVLLDLEPDLCVSWATDDFIQALLEATEQIGGNHCDALEVYLHILQSFSTTEPGVEALVAHLDCIVRKLMKFLNVVCEYEIVGVDRMEGPLTSALSVLNILFTSQIENKDKHSVQNLCKDEKLIRILLKILEPLYPMLQKYKEEFNYNTDSSPSVTDSESHVTTTNQSETVNGVESTNGQMESDSKENNEVEKTDLEEYRQLNVLYEILSSFLIDYCKYLFKDALSFERVPDSPESCPRGTEPREDNSCIDNKGDTSASNKQDSSENNEKDDNSGEMFKGDSSEDIGEGDHSEEMLKGDNSEDIKEGDNSVDIKRGDNSGEILKDNNSEYIKEGDNSEDIRGGDNSEEMIKGDNSEAGDSGLELEKTDSSKEEEIDTATQEDQNIDCISVLTYLDEACSRCRLNYFILTLKNASGESGIDLLNKIYNIAKQFEKERLIRIFDDVRRGRVVSRAESRKILEEGET